MTEISELPRIPEEVEFWQIGYEMGNEEFAMGDGGPLNFYSDLSFSWAAEERTGNLIDPLTLQIGDVSDFDVTITAGDYGDHRDFHLSAGEQTIDLHLNIDYWTDYLIDYMVYIDSEDTAGNKLHYEQKINGVFGGVLDFMADIWDAIVGALSAAWDAVCAAVSLFIEFIKDAIEWAISEIFSPIVSAMDSFRESVKNSLLIVAEDYEADGEISGESINGLNNAIITSPIFLAMSGISIALLALLTFINGVTFGAGTLVMMLISFLIGLILMQMVGSSETGDGSFSVGFSADAITGFVASIISGMFESGSASSAVGAVSLMGSVGSTPLGTDLQAFITGLIEMLVSSAGFMLSVPSLGCVLFDPTGGSAAAWSFLLGIIGIILSAGVATLAGANQDFAALAVGGFAALVSGLSIIMGSIGIHKAGGVSASVRMMGVIGSLIGGSSIILYIYKLNLGV